MSTEEPPEERTPPDPNRENKNTASENGTNRPIQPSADKLMGVAQEAINIAIENAATPEEANIWLALTLTKITILLNPNSNQLDPTKVEDMVN